MQEALWLLSKLTPLGILDVLLVTLIIYGILMLIQGTQADQLVRGIIIVLLVAGVVGYFFQLRIFNWLLATTIPALLFAIPVIFQPELRRMLEQLGRTGTVISHPWQGHVGNNVDKITDEMVNACARLAERRTGALVVLERTTGLEEYVQTGVRINGEVTADLLTQVFFPGSPLHDGAAIVRGDRVVAARCILPLSENVDLDPELGTRHRAAIGVTERSDAVCLVVSEEAGSVSVANNGHLVRHLTSDKLRKVLLALLHPQPLVQAEARVAQPK